MKSLVGGFRWEEYISEENPGEEKSSGGGLVVWQGGVGTPWESRRQLSLWGGVW